jgi:2-C-methyl-D-erythritol 2,4-cyclodiphosphate synthase
MVRIGQGYDVHRLVAGRRLVIGGVDVDFDLGLAGHSDADVLTHAVMDALLGALALGDIGRHFPDTDPRWAGAESIGLLRRVVALLAARNARVLNVDATVVAEKPKLAPHLPLMRARLAEALNVDLDAVSIKATTPEKLGALGRGEGIAAQAVALVETTDP